MCGAVVVTVIVVVTTVVGPCPVAGEEEQVVSAGRPLQVKVIAVVKPVDAMMPTVVLPVPPGAEMLTGARPETAVKPG